MIKLVTFGKETVYINPDYVSIIKQNSVKGYEHLVVVYVVPSTEPFILEGNVNDVKQLIFGE